MSTKLPTLISIDAPGHWAAYLVNGDEDAMDEGERLECEAWLVSNDLNVDDCIGFETLDDENGDGDAVTYFGVFDFPSQGPLQTTMYTYTFELGV